MGQCLKQVWLQWRPHRPSEHGSLQRGPLRVEKQAKFSCDLGHTIILEIVLKLDLVFMASSYIFELYLRYRPTHSLRSSVFRFAVRTLRNDVLEEVRSAEFTFRSLKVNFKSSFKLISCLQICFFSFSPLLMILSPACFIFSFLLSL